MLLRSCSYPVKELLWLESQWPNCLFCNSGGPQALEVRWGPQTPNVYLHFYLISFSYNTVYNSHFLVFFINSFTNVSSGAQNRILKAQQEISVGKRLKINLFVKCPVPISFTICTRRLNSCMFQVFRPRGFREQELI